jgi:hypothetical protein
MKKKTEELLRMIPKEGFIKITRGGGGRSLTGEQKTALIRKGNELYNQGKYELAKRIFVTTGYSDGLLRLGDLYYKRKQILEAFRMYCLAPSKRKVDAMIENMAYIVKNWLREDKKG